MEKVKHKDKDDNESNIVSDKSIRKALYKVLY